MRLDWSLAADHLNNDTAIDRETEKVRMNEEAVKKKLYILFP